MIVLLPHHQKYHRRICFQCWIWILLWYFRWYNRRMIIDCQLKSLLKNYSKTIIVGFGQADVLGFSVYNFVCMVAFILLECKLKKAPKSSNLFSFTAASLFFSHKLVFYLVPFSDCQAQKSNSILFIDKTFSSGPFYVSYTVRLL